MQIVISISEDTYKRHKWRVNHDACTELDIALAKGTPLPKGHGRLIDANYLDITTITTDDYSGNNILDVILKEDLDDAPTIIEADKVESEE